MLHDSAPGFSEANFAPQRQARERQGMCDRQAWRGAGEAGVLGANIPESNGGAGSNECH